MQDRDSGFVLHGALGGAVAGLVVVLWFVVADILAGQAFQTPAELSSIVLHEEFDRPWPRLFALYTVLHFGVFVTLGIVTTWVLRELKLAPGLLLGAIFGVGVLNAVHYTGLLVTGTNLLTVVSAAQVTAANVLGGMMMMAYLHRAQHSDSAIGWNVLKKYPVLFDGLITGLVGAAAVAVWFLTKDLLAQAPLHTPAALGSAVLLGASSPEEIQLNMAVITAYTFLHVSAFAGVGMMFAWLAERVEHRPDFWIRGAAVLLLLEGMFLGTVGMMSGWIMQDLGWMTVLVSNLVAVLAMGLWMLRSRPSLRRVLVPPSVAAQI